MNNKFFSLKRLLIFVLLPALALAFFLTRSDERDEITNLAKPDEYVIKTKSENITSKEFEKRFLTENPQIKLLRGDESYIVTLKKEFAYKLADELILIGLASTSNIRIREEELSAEIETVKDGYSDASFNEMLKQEGITLDKLKESTEKRLIVKKVLDEKVYNDITISDDETADFYSQFSSIFYRPAEYKISKITVQDEARAEEILGFLKSKKVTFDKAVEEYSVVVEQGEETDEAEYLAKSALPVEFESALETLKPGEITDIVNTSQGYHILRLDDKTKGHIPKLAEVKDKIERMIREKKERLAYGAFMDSYRKEREVAVLDEYFEVEKNEE